MAEKGKRRDRMSMFVYAVYMVALALSVVVILKLLCIQCFWKPVDKIQSRLVQRCYAQTVEPKRGNILADDGRILATTFPKYRICLDPTVCRDEFKASSNPDSAIVREARWRAEALEFSKVISMHFPQENADDLYDRIILCRTQGKRFEFKELVEADELEDLRKAPLFRLGRYKGGVWAESVPKRRHPYDNLALRTIGFSLDAEFADKNMQLSEGLDGRYNSELHGQPGLRWLKRTELGEEVNADSVSVEAVDGKNLLTTLNVDYLDITDRALRRYITDDQDIEAACCVMMEVQTGAIKSMINLQRNSMGDLAEYENVAIRRRGEPGSVWKITTLMTLMEDGIVGSTYDEIPTNGSVIPGYKYEEDIHITKEWEKKYHRTTVPIWYGVQVSSNYVFRYLAIHNYESRPQDFIDKLYTYRLGDAWPFDLDGLRKPGIPSSDKKVNPRWTKTDLGQIAMGYGVAVTPLHILTFYNAIAARGRMIRPYLVEGFEKDGKVEPARGPVVLNSSICRPAVADSIGECLKRVTDARGTAWRLSNAKCKVAGKTGTAETYIENVGYQYKDGRKRHLATFVGYFPADAPKYTIICCIYTKPTKTDHYGGTIPVQVVREVVDKVSIIDPYWNESI